MSSAKNPRKPRTSSGVKKERKFIRRKANEALHAEKVTHLGLGRRERRRIAAGIRKQSESGAALT